VETAVFWILRLLGRRFQGRYTPEDIASVLTLAASRETSHSRICQEHELVLSEGVVRYRLRFGTESSYRLMSKSRVRTSTKDPKLRVMYVATSLLLVNAWVEKKWDKLSTKKRGPGGRDVHADLLPYPRFLAMLQYVLEREYGFILAIMVPQKKRAAGSQRR
jgi:hypothetical protein